MSNQANSNKKNDEDGRSDLHRRYGRIGISAVAAAMPYHSQPKKPASSPTPIRPNETESEAE